MFRQDQAGGGGGGGALSTVATSFRPSPPKIDWEDNGVALTADKSFRLVSSGYKLPSSSRLSHCLTSFAFVLCPSSWHPPGRIPGQLPDADFLAAPLRHSEPGHPNFFFLLLSSFTQSSRDTKQAPWANDQVGYAGRTSALYAYLKLSLGHSVPEACFALRAAAAAPCAS